MNKFLIVVALVLLGFGAYMFLQPLSEPDTPQFSNDVFTFYCPDDFTFTMQYDAQGEYARLSLRGVQYTLERAPSGSGARYVGVNNATQFWEHQDEAMLQLPGMTQELVCSRTPQSEEPVPEPDQNDNIVVTSPKPGEQVRNPITLQGMARGYWFFEASAPVVVTNWDGLIIGEGIITADGEWMTEEMVPFSGTLAYELPENSYSATGTLIFMKDNPSGLPENDEAYEMTIMLQE